MHGIKLKWFWSLSTKSNTFIIFRRLFFLTDIHLWLGSIWDRSRKLRATSKPHPRWQLHWFWRGRKANFVLSIFHLVPFPLQGVSSQSVFDYYLWLLSRWGRWVPVLLWFGDSSFWLSPWDWFFRDTLGTCVLGCLWEVNYCPF